MGEEQQAFVVSSQAVWKRAFCECGAEFPKQEDAEQHREETAHIIYELWDWMVN